MLADALVIGGGPAGALSALLLARAGCSVVLVEKARFPRRKVCGEFITASGLALLSRLGLDETVAGRAGPPVRTLALWAGGRACEAPMPALAGETPYPRALERDVLDARLIEQAANAGVRVLQPAAARSLVRTRFGFACLAEASRGGPQVRIDARAAIAAHGSWEPGPLLTQPPRLAPRPDDLLGFQAHFDGLALPAGNIVLAPFPGGYAGLVERDGGRATLACCVRRDALAGVRALHPKVPAGEALLLDLSRNNVLVQDAVRHAERAGSWLAAGPLRPGARPAVQDGVFVVGNAAGEAHPVVGEGIALALKSAELLAASLARALRAGYSPFAARAAALEYAWRWRRLAGPRLWTSARFAALVTHPSATRRAEALAGRAPALMTLAARLSGKGGWGRATARTSPG